MNESLQMVCFTSSFRANSEDRVALHRLSEGVVVVVADGAGGIRGGGRAAYAVLKLVASALSAPSFDARSPISWTTMLGEADRQIEVDPTAGETTATVVHVIDAGVVGVTVGDSGALLASEEGAVVDITAEQARYRKRRLGSGRAVPTAIESSLPAGATLVVATDGLLAYARHDAVARAILGSVDLDEVAQNLVDAVRLLLRRPHGRRGHRARALGIFGLATRPVPAEAKIVVIPVIGGLRRISNAPRRAPTQICEDLAAPRRRA